MKLCEMPDIPDLRKLYFREAGPYGGTKAPETPATTWVRTCRPEDPAVPGSRLLYDRRGKSTAASPALAGSPYIEPLTRPATAACAPADGLQPLLFDARDSQLAERSALRLSALVHDYSDAIIIRDFRDRIIAWNRGAQRMYGYTEDEALGMNASLLIPKKMPVPAREAAQRPVRGNRTAAIVTKRRTRDGRILDVELTFKVLCDEKGVPVELATTERDITQQLKADRELRRLHARVISVQETERKRLARELHDGVGQILSGVKFRLESLPGKIALSGKSKAKVLELGGILDHAISEVRRVSKNLMPPELEDLGLEPALRTLCREFNGRGGAQVTLKTEQIPGTVPPELALALFRIAQEALNNTGKHSKATEVEVDLSRKGMELLLSVSDNGIGFIPGCGKPPSERGIGLGSMRERAESVGGFLEFRSSPGAGTKLLVHAPLLTPGGAVR